MQIDVRGLARSTGTWERTLQSAALPRLAAILEDAKVPIEVRLEFSTDPLNRVRVGGQARFRPTILCQRCIEALPADVCCGFNLCIVASGEEADEVMEFADPVVAVGGLTCVQDLIEDDLILALPRFACQGVECERFRDLAYGSELAGDNRPFASILDLKKQLRCT